MLDVVSDTRPEIASLMRKLLRETTPERKLAMVGQINQTVKILALSGLRSQYPDETPQMIQRRLADILLGKFLAAKVYGSPAE